MKPLAHFLLLSLVVSHFVETVQSADIDYNRQIRPILSNKCFKCHGPDPAERKGNLRLDVRDAAVKPAESGERAIVPADVDHSELVRRIFSPDRDVAMPPADEQKQLTVEEKELLKRWIATGAAYQSHWAFVAPRRPAVPQPSGTNAMPFDTLPASRRGQAESRNPIDAFIQQRLHQEGLRPSPTADRVTLIRRVTLDLTGLPPTPLEVDAFVADQSPLAYEKLIDRLLASPHYGERMAVDWLDAARFADTNGYHIDNGRDMTRWREWVIAAYTKNKPFDQFTLEQLAGDLLPNATLDQKIGSGFNRNHMINFEGGAIPEEYHNAYLVDRVNTTSTVWLGLSVACAQCHDHKYDPITQREYYQLYAYFFNVPESGLDGRKGNAAPLLKAPTGDQERQLTEIAMAIAALDQQLAAPLPAVDAAQQEWERSLGSQAAVVWRPLDATELAATNGSELKIEEKDKAIVVTGPNPAQETYLVTGKTDLAKITGLRLELLPDERLSGKGPGRSVNGNVVLTELRVHSLGAGDAAATPVKLKAAAADFSQADFPVANAIDGKPDTGWAIFPDVGKPHFAVIAFDQPVAVPANGVSLQVRIEFQSKFAQHQAGRFRLTVTDAADPFAADSLPAPIRATLAVAADQRSPQQRDELRKHYREQISPELRQLRADLANLQKKRQSLEEAIPTVMVMEEMAKPRDTFIRMRGAYDKLGDKVTPSVPSFLPPLPEGAPNNRLGLAQWLIDPRHPLTGRVAVNRLWQTFFGTGLVKTTEEFGSQGDMPSHPELLDWLATEFQSPQVYHSTLDDTRQEFAWNVKALVKLMLMSATYRQAAGVTPELRGKDPENRLLARGPRFRLQAEFIRDQALAVSGLLDRRIGGHSVSPYQPSGLWEELMARADGKNWTAQEYTQSHGPDLYRRTMYTFWKRTCPPAQLATFDAPDRETCTVRRARTNTPLQALILLNDPTYVEASRKFAERILREGGPTVPERIAFAFRMVNARRPSDREIAVLHRVLEKQFDKYRDNLPAAEKLLAVGESPRDERLNPTELAAWTMLASVILNLDEAVTKG